MKTNTDPMENLTQTDWNLMELHRIVGHFEGTMPINDIEEYEDLVKRLQEVLQRVKGVKYGRKKTTHEDLDKVVQQYLDDNYFYDYNAFEFDEVSEDDMTDMMIEYVRDSVAWEKIYEDVSEEMFEAREEYHKYGRYEDF